MRSLQQMMYALRLDADEFDKVTVSRTVSVAPFTLQSGVTKPVWFAGSVGVIMTISESEAQLLVSRGAQTPAEKRLLSEP